MVTDCYAITLGVMLYIIADVIAIAKPLVGDNVEEFQDFIDVRSPPIIVEGPSPNVVYGVGDRVVLACKGRGNPSPSYEWYYNGERMETFGFPNADRYVRDLMADGTLHLKTSAKGTVGNYQCHVINELGVAISNNSRLDEAVYPFFSSCIVSQPRMSHLQECLGWEWNHKPLAYEAIFHPIIGRHARTVVRNVTVIEGRSAVLHCDHFVSFPAATVSWYSADSHVSSTPSTIGVPHSWTGSGRLTQPLQPSDRITLDDRGGLVIVNVAKGDEMLYKCQAYNYVLRSTSGGSYQRLLVETAPYETHYTAPEIIYTSPPMIVLTGNDVTLTCIFSSRSALQITWKRKTGEMASNAYSFDYGRRLRLVAVTPSDAGLYQCIASDGIADTQAAVSLDVDALPTVSINPDHRDVTVGGSASFECHGNGRPSPHYSWYINAFPVHESSISWRLLNSGRHLELYDITLVPGFTVTCNVSNVYGHVLSASYVTVLPAVTDESSSTQATTSIAMAIETETDSYDFLAESPTVSVENTRGYSSDSSFIDATATECHHHIKVENSQSLVDVELLPTKISTTLPIDEQETNSPTVDDVSTSGQSLETSPVFGEESVDALLISSLRQVLVRQWRKNSTAAVLILATISLVFPLVAFFTILICRRSTSELSTYRVREQEQRCGRKSRDERQTTEDEQEIDCLNTKSTSTTVNALVPLESSLTSLPEEEDDPL